MTDMETRRDQAIREDRERLFRVTDAMRFQPKYAKHLDELESIVQEWRDITERPEYPNIAFPLPTPEWMPIVHFASRWTLDDIEAMDAEKENMETEEVQ